MFLSLIKYADRDTIQRKQVHTITTEHAESVLKEVTVILRQLKYVQSARMDKQLIRKEAPVTHSAETVRNCFFFWNLFT